MTKKTSGKTTQANNPPVAKLRIGLVNASIWERATDDGVFYSVSFERRYNKNGEWQSTQSYGYDDLLTLAKLADQAHNEITKLRNGEAE